MYEKILERKQRRFKHPFLDLHHFCLHVRKLSSLDGVS